LRPVKQRRINRYAKSIVQIASNTTCIKVEQCAARIKKDHLDFA